MKKILVLGAQGMLGSALYAYLKKQEINVERTSRSGAAGFIYFNVNADFIKNFKELINKVKPDCVVNCIGFIRPTRKDFKEAILVNSMFPQIASLYCSDKGIGFIHISTDCVFNGERGKYEEDDVPDETSVYGLSKFLGEADLTIRTSIIGRELKSQKNLLEWFLNSKGEVNGFIDVLWNGVTTLTLSKIIYRIIIGDLEFDKPLIQIASETVSKYELLKMFKKIYKKDIIITKRPGPKIDKTLVPSVEQGKYFNDLIISLNEQIIELKNANSEW